MRRKSLVLSAPAVPLIALFLAAAGVSAHVSAQPADDLVRIRLFELEAPERIALYGEDGGLTFFAGDYPDAPIAVLPAGDTALVYVDEGEIYLSLPDGGIRAFSIDVAPEPDGHFTAEVVAGARRTEPRQYAGRLAVAPDDDAPERLLLINHLDLERYVASVLAAEYGMDDREGARAMAVVIRTYAVRSAGRFGPAYDHVDHTGSQVYQGAGAATRQSLEAARSTSGEILTYRDRPIEAVYFASSGGHTANNEDVWESTALPYLRGKPDPHDTDSPYRTWQSRIDRAALNRILTREYGFEAARLSIDDRSLDGRARSITLVRRDGRRKSVPANAFRLLVQRNFGANSLRSLLFRIDTRGGDYLFEGSGFGHGVGLNQWGAYTLSRAGRSYRDILAFYYTGVALYNLDTDASEPLARRSTRSGW